MKEVAGGGRRKRFAGRWRTGRSIEAVACNGMAGGGEMAADLVGDAGVDGDIQQGEVPAGLDRGPRSGGGETIVGGDGGGVADNGHLAGRAGLMGQGGVEAAGAMDAAVNEGGVVFFDGEGLELAAEGGIGGGGFGGENQAGGLGVQPMKKGGKEAVASDVGEGGIAGDEGVGEGVGFGMAEGVGWLAGGLVEGQEEVVLVQEG
jgi:hypothetical protein